MRNEIETIVKSMLKESMGNDALKSFAKQLKIVLNEARPIGREAAKREIYEHISSALRKYYQITLMRKKKYLTRENKANVKKWLNNLDNNILKQIEKSNLPTKKRFYWKMSDIEKMINNETRQDAHDFAVDKIERSLDFVPSFSAPKTTLKKMYELVGRKIPNWK